MQRPELPLHAGHPIAEPRTGRLTPPWVIFFQQLIRYVHEAALVPVDLGSEVSGTLPPAHGGGGFGGGDSRRRRSEPRW